MYKLYDSPAARLKEALHPFRKLYHRDFYALNDVSFEVEQGETLGIIGQNGSGKSTLLQILAGVVTPSAGNVAVNGKVAALLELGAGFNPEFTGLENIYFQSSILGYSKHEIDKHRDAIIEFADIGEFITQPVKVYSTGMLVRLAFAIASNVEPDIFIIDEALAVGDEAFQRKCFAKIQSIREQGATILFVSHSAGTVLELCDRAILLDEGELILEGSPKLVVDQYHKLVYTSNTVQHHKMKIDILMLNHNTTLKKNFENVRKEETAFSPEIHEQQATENQQAFYAPVLQSKSVVEYGHGGIEIYDINITTLHDEPVNMLVMDRRYIYTYKVGFSVDVEQINFGMMIKSKTGIDIGGAIYPRTNDYVPKIVTGEHYLFQWYFTCNLLPGMYCTNVGVMAEVEGQREYLGRIVDAILFKVQDVPERVYNVGFIHFHQKLVHRKIAPIL